MTSTELNAELFRQLSIIAEDEGLMKKAVSAIKRIAASKVNSKETKDEIVPYTLSELHERIRRSEADIASGRVFTEKELDEKELKEMPWLAE